MDRRCCSFESLIRGVITGGLLMLAAAVAPADDLAADRTRWTSGGPRSEVLPEFQWNTQESSNGPPGLLIRAGDQAGLHGWWSAVVPVTGGQCYSFSADVRITGVKLPRRTVVTRIQWMNRDGRSPLRDQPVHSSYRPGERPRAEPEYVPLKEGKAGLSTAAGYYRAPGDAVTARIELSLRWERNAEAVWSDIRLEQIESIPARPVRLATVHFSPRDGTTAADKCAQFEPFIRSAADQNADLVVLPETLTYFGSGRPMSECAEAIPGESTKFFGRLCKELDLYVVAGLLERSGNLVYNVAVLIGPSGKVEGVYRKTCLPRGEIDAGIVPGDDYPVFPTRFGKLGMMVCYDGFFPEVARQLSNRGAEVIAFPVWGCNPMLAAARACENHVYVVSSTYTQADANWMITGIFGRDGKVLAKADEWGQVVVTEVNLNAPTLWHSLGDFRSEIPVHRPLSFGEFQESVSGR